MKQHPLKSALCCGFACVVAASVSSCDDIVYYSAAQGEFNEAEAPDLRSSGLLGYWHRPSEPSIFGGCASRDGWLTLEEDGRATFSYFDDERCFNDGNVKREGFFQWGQARSLLTLTVQEASYPETTRQTVAVLETPQGFEMLTLDAFVQTSPRRWVRHTAHLPDVGGHFAVTSALTVEGDELDPTDCQIRWSFEAEFEVGEPLRQGSMAVEAPCKRVFEPEEGWVRLTLLPEDDIYIDSIVTQDEAYLALHEDLQLIIRHAYYPSLVYYPERPDVLFGRATHPWFRSDTPRAELLEE